MLTELSVTYNAYVTSNNQQGLQFSMLVLCKSKSPSNQGKTGSITTKEENVFNGSKAYDLDVYVYVP
ncbi:hypothetical protein UPYG_G00030330 [Umbra pygmaea]|uniref:Uncharacterized protein n=1 Tax=Umbra pygmaea TaxID=75934 RepID=A0ABD0XQ06_UMBPY